MKELVHSTPHSLFFISKLYKQYMLPMTYDSEQLVYSSSTIQYSTMIVAFS